MRFGLDNLGLGLQTLVLGVIVVFAALAVIWLVVSVMGVVFQRRSASKKQKTEIVPDFSDMPIVLADDPSAQSEELVAAITAAICAYENKPVGSFRVVSFKKR
ncbi:MAG: OadG family protein [Clostridia bacterium]|nr:OadG family protein [Clostridia bacterium]